MTRDLNKTVAIATIHRELAGVQTMVKSHRLIRLISNSGVVWCKIIPIDEGKKTTKNTPAEHELERQVNG